MAPHLPDGYFTVRTPIIYRTAAFFRAFVKDGDVAGAIKSVKAGFRLYPLSKAANPPAQKFLNVSGVKYNTIHANDYTYFDELDRVVQNEPEDTFEPQLTGTFAAIGIKKGAAVQSGRPDEEATHRGGRHRQRRRPVELVLPDAEKRVLLP